MQVLQQEIYKEIQLADSREVRGKEANRREKGRKMKVMHSKFVGEIVIIYYIVLY